jgi:glycosyltransferase involved in cell wall biosynthesis
MIPRHELEAGISVVVPVYNSEKTLPLLYERLAAAMAAIRVPFDIIFVDDGSADRSWDVISSIARDHRAATGIRMMRNYGQHNALLCGIRAARRSIIVTMDDDLQNPPEEIPKLLAKLEEGFHVVYGVPERLQHGFARDLASRVTKLALQNAMGAESAANVSAFRAFRTELRNAFWAYNSPYVCIDVLLTWATRRFGSAKVRHDERAAGRSNYTFGRLFAHAMNMMTGYSTLPLQMASISGFILTAFGFVILIVVIVRYFASPEVPPGFPFLASIVAIFSGAQLFALGIMGEYIARIHLRMMDRPSYTVQITTHEDPFAPQVNEQRTL